jgi:glycogen debranching enzyme
MIGRHDDARELFERLLGLCNDLGLLAEEYDTDEGRQAGNFPQAFSHVALVNAGLNLSGLPPASAVTEVATKSGALGPVRRHSSRSES